MSSSPFGSSSCSGSNVNVSTKSFGSTTSRSSAGGGARRRAKAPVPIAALLAGGGTGTGSGRATATSSRGPCTLAPKGPEPPISIVKQGGDRGFAKNRDLLTEMPTPDYFNRVIAEMDRQEHEQKQQSSETFSQAGGGHGGGSDHILPFSSQPPPKRTSTTITGTSGSGADVSPFTFPDDPKPFRISGTSSPCMLDMDDDQVSAEFSLHEIISERSKDDTRALTDDEIKQREIDRMRESSTTALQPGRPVTPPPLSQDQSRGRSPISKTREENPKPRQASPRPPTRGRSPPPLRQMPNVTGVSSMGDDPLFSESLRQIIAERSHGITMTDDEIKQQEIQLMRDAAAVTSLPRPQQRQRARSPAPRQTISSMPMPPTRVGLPEQEMPQPMARQRQEREVSPLKRTSSPIPMPRSPVSSGTRPGGARVATNNRTIDDEDLLSSDSLHRIIVGRSHGIMTDDAIKQQEIQRRMMDFSVPEQELSLPQARRREQASSPVARPQQRASSPIPRPVSTNKPQQRASSPNTIPRSPRSSSRPGGDQRVTTNSCIDEDPLSSESLHRIIVGRSHGIMTDDAIKQQEIQRRMMDFSVPEQELSMPRARRQEASSPVARPQQRTSSPIPRPISTNKAQQRASSPTTMPRMNPGSVTSKNNDDGDALVVLSLSQHDTRIKQQEENMTLNSIIMERASNATAESLSDEDSRSKREARSTNNNPANNSSNTTNSTRSTSQSSTTAAQVEYSSRGQPMVKHRLPPGAKKPGAYSGAPGTGYNRVSSLRFPLLGGGSASASKQRNDESVTLQMEDSSCFGLPSSSLASATSTGRNQHHPMEATTNEEEGDNTTTNKGPMEKKKSFRKRFGKVKAVFKFVGRLRKGKEKA